MDRLAQGTGRAFQGGYIAGCRHPHTKFVSVAAAVQIGREPSPGALRDAGQEVIKRLTVSAIDPSEGGFRDGAASVKVVDADRARMEHGGTCGLDGSPASDRANNKPCCR